MGRPELLEIDLNNREYLEQLYADYQHDYDAVDDSWRQLFSEVDTTSAVQIHPSKELDDFRIFNLVQAYRTYGHLFAKINPLAIREPELPWQLQLKTLGFTDSDIHREFPTTGLLQEPTAPLEQIVAVLQKTYCDKIGIEYMGLQNPELKLWLQQQIESTHFRVNLSIEQKRLILHYLNKSELFESFLHTKYVGQKRFSLEGAETLIPMLSSVLETGAGLGLEELLICMAHRGRLNVLTNILHKSFSEIFSEFEESFVPQSIEGSGDVKYHLGFSSDVKTESGKPVQVIVTSNPSHLEAVDPVIQGMVYARQQKRGGDNGRNQVMALAIHGDAAIAGQGIVYETLQFYGIDGYSIGGTLHIVINNQIGFTALPQETRSTRYCTDIARAFDAPVFHVNAEDPEGCVYATYLALQLRQKFHCDVFIDLYCYRKYGHNEADEPAFTQPLEYQIIRHKKPIREVYRDRLIQEGIVEKSIAESLEQEFTQELQAAREQMIAPETKKQPKRGTHKQQVIKEIDTKVSRQQLEFYAERLTIVPEGFFIHSKLGNQLKEHLAMVKEDPKGKPIDWGMAELLAYSSLLCDGIPVRLSGQDSCRGTFSHRHAVWVDQQTSQRYCALNHIQDGQAPFCVLNSPLSECGVLGFEVGFSYGYPEALVIWEAQFGDFANGAQVVIDQFISSAEQKWGQKSGIVLFLPHGYEGQGPEHSSARIERYLSLCGEDNMRVVYPTQPNQLFHLLRRQKLNPTSKPLVVFTPKGLLRHPQSVCRVADLTDGQFSEVLDDPAPPEKIKRVLLCTGRIFFDLIAERDRVKNKDTAVVRIEQLYPLHEQKLSDVLSRYHTCKEFLWVQEEPSNMGAWVFLHEQLQLLLPKKATLVYTGRGRCAVTSAGSYARHKQEHTKLMQAVFV